MKTERKIPFGLTGNQLKIIALLSMTCDHVGYQLLNNNKLAYILGRLAFPIFAYMIAEGARYTRNRKKYFFLTFGVGLFCQIVYFVTSGSLYQCILITFSCSLLLIYTLDHAIKRANADAWGLFAFLFLAVFFLVHLLPPLLPHTDYRLDYGIWGVLCPVLVFLGRNKWQKLLFASVALVFLALTYGEIQWFAFAAIPLLALYNGRRGTWNLKYLFYIYYPLHLGVIALLALLRGG